MIRQVILEERRLAFSYRSEIAEAPAWREVLLYGHRAYLMAAFPWETEPVNYRLDRMSELRVVKSGRAVQGVKRVKGLPVAPAELRRWRRSMVMLSPNGSGHNPKGSQRAYLVRSVS